MSAEDLLALGYIQSDYDDMDEPTWIWEALKRHMAARNKR